MAVERNPNLPQTSLGGALNTENDPANLPDNVSMNPVDDGGLEFEFSEEEINALLDEVNGEEREHYDNLVSELDEEELKKIASLVIDAYEADEASRESWMNTVVDGMDLLGLDLSSEGGLFENACGAHHPLILEACVKFQSKASAELLPSGGPVKTHVLGQVTREKEEAATRKQEHMNWQLTTQMPEFYDETEKMLFYTPAIGLGFKKLFYDSVSARPSSTFLTVDRFVVPYGAKDIERAARTTEIIYKSKDEMKADAYNGFYREDAMEALGAPTQVSLSDFQTKQGQITGVLPTDSEFDAAYTLLEQHVNMYIEGLEDDDEDELAKPYIITVDMESGTVLGIRRNWKPSDPLFKKKVFYVQYSFVPGMGFYGLGYIHLLGNLQKTLTASMRALVDAGQFATLPGGLKTKGVRFNRDDGPIGFGEWREVETAGMSIKDSFMPLPYKEPSQTLFNMLQFMEGRGQKFADSTEQVLEDSSNYGPVGTTMALLDASTKFFNAIHKRLHNSQKKELRILADINSEYLDEQYAYQIPGRDMLALREDYTENMDVIPVSDPNISSSAQRITLATTKIQMAQQAPAGTVNMKELLKRAFLAMGEKDIDKIILPDEETKPSDPVTDIMSAVQGKPIKGFPGQDHQAHIQVKEAWLQDPTNGGSPTMQVFAPVIQANIQEHMVLQYQEQLQGAIQATGAATDQQTMEMVIAKAAKMVSENNQAAQLKLAEGTPETKIANAELLKAQTDKDTLEHTRKKDYADYTIQAEKAKTDRYKVMGSLDLEDNKIKNAAAKNISDKGFDMVFEALKGMHESKTEAVKGQMNNDNVTIENETRKISKGEG